MTSAVLRAAAALLGQAQQLADPRITNTGLKLLGAGLHGAERVLKERHVLAAELRHGIVAMDANVGTLSQQRFDASLGAEGRRVRIRLSRPPRRLLIIAAANSRPARRLRRLLGKQLEIGWAIWAGPPPATRPELAHSQAFYPKPTTTYAPEEVALTGTKFTSFVCLADAVTKARYEVGLLIGMPVIPKALLACFPGPVVNVHNGQVPIYRGMDAVAWALWNDDPVYVCAHVVLPTVDSGPVLGEVLLDTNDPGALRALVSQATLELLLETATRLVHAPELETLEGRGATTRVGSLFRMHPLLRRHLRTRLERP